MKDTNAQLGEWQHNSLRFNARRIVLLLGLAILTFAFLLALGGGREALHAIATVKPTWLLLALAIHYSGFAIRGLRWQQLLGVMGYRFRWRYITTLLLSGWFVSALLPARAGDLLRVGILRMADDSRPTVPLSDGLGSIVLERVVDLCALVILGASAGFLVLRNELPIWIFWTYIIACTALFVVVLIVLLIPQVLMWLAARWQQPHWQRLLHFAIEILQSVRTLGRHPGMVLMILFESFYIWLCDALLMWLVLVAMGITTSLGTITFVALSVDISAAIPITPGGIGQIEAVNAALLALLPLTSSQIAAAILLNRAISYWSFMLFSGIVTFTTGLGQLLPKLSIASPLANDSTIDGSSVDESSAIGN